MPRKIARAASLDSDDLDSNTAAVPSSVTANSSRKASKSTTASNLSDEDEDMEEVEEHAPRKRKTRSSVSIGRRTPSGRKRPASEALDNDDDQTDADNPKPSDPTNSYDTPIARLSKRVMREVYVEIPHYRRGLSSSSSSMVDDDLGGKVDIKGKGKALPLIKRKSSASSPRTPARPTRKASRNTTGSSGTDLLSDTSLDYDDHIDDEKDVEESEDDSGSNFELSDEDGGKDDLVLMGSAPSGDDSEDDQSLEEGSSKAKRKHSKRQANTKRSTNANSSDDDIPLAFAMAADDDEEAEMLRVVIEKSKLSAVPGSNAFAKSSTSPYKTRRSGRGMSDEESPSELSDDSSAHCSGESGPDDRGGFVTKKGAKVAKQTVKSKVKRKTKKEIREEAAARRNPGQALLRKERQKLGRKLTWAERTNILLRLHHPELQDVWGDLEEKVQPVVPEKAEQPAALKVSLLPFQQESLFWMRKQEQTLWHGGCLADEMGMGKTIQTLALLASDRKKPNLIIAPTVAIMQWRNEIEAHTSGFKVNIFHGSAREKDAEALEAFDVVLTTYAVLESTFRRQHKGFTKKGVILKESSVLHEVEWARVVLDEAHNIKERSCNTAKAAFELKAQYRWCLSGTPLQNRVGELYSIVRFLGGDPFSYYFCKNCPCKSLTWSFTDKKSCDDCGHSPMNHTCFWNNEILTPIQKHAMQGPGQTAFRKLKILLQRMMLRRTKVERADDLGLPPRTVIVRRDYFSPEEKELYLSLFSDAKRTFSTYVDAGTLLNNYSNVFTLITRMRQMACHPDLVLKSRTNQTFSADVVEATVCRLCNDIAEDAIESKCHHIFDRECIKQYIDISADIAPSCPVCHVALSIDLDAPAIEQEETVVKKARQGILGRLDLDTWRSSSKIEALVEELSNLRRDDRTTKSLVFSQFVNFLDLIAWRLQKAGFVICRLEGTMTPQARDLTIKHFMNNVDVTVFLVSLKAGGVALNLVEASRVYLMDSWWNPAVEFQAMDRIHRLGQHRPVHAIKLVIEDSIESRIVQLQEKKSAMVDATLSSDDSAMGRLTPEDLGFLFRL